MVNPLQTVSLHPDKKIPEFGMHATTIPEILGWHPAQKAKYLL